MMHSIFKNSKVARSFSASLAALLLVSGTSVTALAAEPEAEEEVVLNTAEEADGGCDGYDAEELLSDICGSDESDMEVILSSTDYDDDDYDDDDYDDDDYDDDDEEDDDDDDYDEPVMISRLCVTGIDLGVTAGAKPAYTAKMSSGDGKKAAVLCEKWTAENGAVSCSDAGAYRWTDEAFYRFSYQKNYTYSIVLKAKEGYFFTEDTMVALNGTYYEGVVSSDAERIYITNAFSRYADCQHEYQQEKVLKAAGCTTEGQALFTCKNCGSSRTDSIPALGHDYQQVTEKASMTADGSTYEKCINCSSIVNRTAIGSIKDVSLSGTSYTYNGSAKTPKAVVKDRNGKTISSSYYTISYRSNTSVGKASAVITFKNLYKGSTTLEFTINPGKTSISAVTALTKGFTVKWKKNTTQTTGYQIQYSTNSSFKSAVTKTISSNTTVSKKVTGLKTGTKYYVRVRTYRKVGSTSYVSGWSAKKSVKTK